MMILIIGLVLFLGMHSIRIYAADWREAQINKRGHDYREKVRLVVEKLAWAM